jgi:hypothetical protein
MIRAFLVVLLTSVSCSAFAQQWTEAGRRNNGDLVYINLGTIRADGSKRTFWMRHEFKKPIGDIYSARTKFSIDCVKETITTLSRDVFNQPSLKGGFRAASFSTDERHISPDTDYSVYMSVVCSK